MAALFFSVSDRTLYEKLESLLPGRFPGRTFAFLGDTFSDVAPWRPGDKGGLLPTSRLLWRWVLMNEFTVRKVAPALSEHDFVFVREFGREAYLYAIRHRDCYETLEFHKALVAERLIEQQINPPEYLASPPEDARLRHADKVYFEDPKQKLTYLAGETCDQKYLEVLRLVQQRLRERVPELQRA